MLGIFNVIYGNLEKVKRMVNENPEIVHVKDCNGWTPLDCVIAHGKLKIAKYLWDMGGRPNLDIHRDGESTPVHWIEQKDILEWVFENKVLPLSMLNIKDKDQWTPLDIAINCEKLEIAKFLFEKGGRPNLDIYRDGNYTPVHWAARERTDTLEWVFAEKILPLRVLKIKDWKEWTPLDNVAEYGKPETAAIFRRLLHLDPVFLAMQRAKRDHNHQMCVLRRLPNELLDMVVEEVAACHGLQVMW